MSNQAIRNKQSSYYVQDLEDYTDNDLLKWDGKGHQVENSGISSPVFGEMTLNKIICSTLEVSDIFSTGGNPVCLEGIVEFDKLGTNANISYGQACDPNINDINSYYECKRDINMFLKSDTDDVATNDDPNIYLSRDGNTVASKICMCTTSQDFKFYSGSDTATLNNPNITFYTGTNYPVTGGLPNFSSGIEALSISGDDQSLMLKKYIQFTDISAPANGVNGTGRLYKKIGDDGLFWKPDSLGPEVDLTGSSTSGSNSGTWTGGTGWSQTVVINWVKFGDMVTLRFSAESDTQSSTSIIQSPIGFLDASIRPSVDCVIGVPGFVSGSGRMLHLEIETGGRINIGEFSNGTSSTPNILPTGTHGWSTIQVSYSIN